MQNILITIRKNDTRDKWLLVTSLHQDELIERDKDRYWLTEYNTLEDAIRHLPNLPKDILPYINQQDTQSPEPE